MVYSSIEHNIVKAGQAWSCKSTFNAARVLIVAVDSYPGGTAVNIVIEFNNESEDPGQILAPIAFSYLEPDLVAVVANDVNVSQHIPDYTEWKRMANEGQAGIWTCSIDTIIATLNEANAR
jgi:hypothetical protein